MTTTEQAVRWAVVVMVGSSGMLRSCKTCAAVGVMLLASEGVLPEMASHSR